MLIGHKFVKLFQIKNHPVIYPILFKPQKTREDRISLWRSWLHNNPFIQEFGNFYTNDIWFFVIEFDAPTTTILNWRCIVRKFNVTVLNPVLDVRVTSSYFLSMLGQIVAIYQPETDILNHLPWQRGFFGPIFFASSPLDYACCVWDRVFSSITACLCSSLDLCICVQILWTWRAWNAWTPGVCGRPFCCLSEVFKLFGQFRIVAKQDLVNGTELELRCLWSSFSSVWYDLGVECSTQSWWLLLEQWHLWPPLLIPEQVPGVIVVQSFPPPPPPCVVVIVVECYFTMCNGCYLYLA